MTYVQDQVIGKTGIEPHISQKATPQGVPRTCILGRYRASGDIKTALSQLGQSTDALVGLVSFPGQSQREPANRTFPLLGSFENLEHIVEDHNIEQVVIACDDEEHEFMLAMADRCHELNLTVYLMCDSLERVVKLSLNRDVEVPLLPFSRARHTALWRGGKRVFDFIFSLTAIVLTSPIWLVSALAIKLSDPGPVFYNRKVVGKDGRTFVFHKFRTMYHNNDDSIHQEYVKELITKGSQRQVYKLTSDPRITSVGRLLRKFSLDELPQFLNALKGDMSVVGPRPCNVEEYQYYKEWHKRRTQVKPGITGLWQVRARSSVNYDEMVMLDLFYIQRQSYLLDLMIALETLPVMLFGKGAH